MRPDHTGTLQALFPKGGVGGGLLHFCPGGCGACGLGAVARPVYHVDLFRKGSPKKITEPWAKPPETPTDGAGTSPLAAIGDDAEKVKLLKRRLAEARIKSGDASTAERLAFQVSSSAAKKARKEKDAKKNNEKNNDKDKRKNKQQKS